MFYILNVDKKNTILGIDILIGTIVVNDCQ